MDKQYLHELDAAYQEQMQEVNENIEAQVRVEFKSELDRTKSANSKATFWNGLVSRFRNQQQAEKDHHNTQTANETRLNSIEERVQGEMNKRSQEQANLMEADIFEDFGGSREAAFEQLEQYEEGRKEQIKGIAKDQFQTATGEKQRKLEAQKGKAQWDFDVASGRQQEKQEEIKGEAKKAFQEASQSEKERHDQQAVKPLQSKKEERVSLELKTPKQDQENQTLDTSYWKQADQVETQADNSHLLTTSKESSYDAEMATRITKSFDRSEGKEQSWSF